MLHGFPEFWYGWRQQIPALAEAGYRVLAPDQRGYNLSDKPRGIDAYQLDQLAADIVGLIDAAGREKAVIVGHDWGGGVAWWLALKHAARVSKLVILNSPHPAEFEKQLRSNPAQLLKSAYFFYFNLPWLPEKLILARDCAQGKRGLTGTSRPGTFSDADLQLYCEAWSRPNAMTSMLNWYRAVIRRPSPRPADQRAHMPALILWGQHDAFLRRELADASAAYCDDVRLETLDTTHWVQHEAPDQVNRFLLDFLA